MSQLRTPPEASPIPSAPSLLREAAGTPDGWVIWGREHWGCWSPSGRMKGIAGAWGLPPSLAVPRRANNREGGQACMLRSGGVPADVK